MPRDDQNPYAPPVDSSAEPHAAAPPTAGMRLSGQGWDLVAGMAKWMRIVAVSEWVVGALLAAAAVFVVGLMGRTGTQRGDLAVMGGLCVVAVLFVLGGVWLRQAAGSFYHGVLSDAERPLADGFRKLRLYLILYGLYSVVGLVAQVYQLVSRPGR